MPDISASSMIEVLTRIWQDVLRLPTIDIEDNFFDVGGDSVLALQLFAQVAEVCGRQLPPVLIYQVPTIAAQAALMEQTTSVPLSPIVPLKTGRDHPVFIAPGLGGGPAEFFQLVKHIRTPRSIHGLQPRGLDGFEEPARQIYEMAESYLQAIKQFQPSGPYVLFGYSLGGLVAFEMAHRLSSEGHQIGLLVMLDSYPHIRYLPAAQRLRLRAQRLKWRITSTISGRAPNGRARTLNPSQASAFAPGMDDVKHCAFSALEGYRPKFYPGNIKFVRAETVSDFPSDPAEVWGPLASGLEVETVPGDHLGMLTLHYSNLGSVLTRYLEEVSLPPAVPGETK